MYKDREREKVNQVYRWAKTRCTNPNIKQWADYGGRGIQFKFKSFEEFLMELGERPLGYMLDRINNNGHYEIGNVRWTTRLIQNKNKRMYKTNSLGLTGVSFIKAKGKYKTDRFCARGYNENGKRIELYKGPDFFEACCARKSWECHQE